MFVITQQGEGYVRIYGPYLTEAAAEVDLKAFRALEESKDPCLRLCTILRRVRPAEVTIQLRATRRNHIRELEEELDELRKWEDI